MSEYPQPPQRAVCAFDVIASTLSGGLVAIEVIDVLTIIDEDTMGLVLRLHHCLADGATSMRFCGCLLWSEDPQAGPCVAAPWVPVMPW